MYERILDAVQRHRDALGFWPRSGAVARMCELPSSTTTEAIRRLAGEDLLDYKPYGKVKLTTKGTSVLKEYLRHKRLLETFFITELNIDHDAAHRISSEIAMRFPCTLVQKICTKYGHPDECPGGFHIPKQARCHCEGEVKIG